MIKSVTNLIDPRLARRGACVTCPGDRIWIQDMVNG